MILARLSRAIREQNWFAVMLEFVIVIAGVVIGFQVTAWNADRGERQSELRYLSSLIADVDLTIERYRSDLDYRGNVRLLGLRALAIVEGNAAPRDDWDIVLTFFNASQVGGGLRESPTFNELVSSGDLQIISNARLRQRLSSYYTPGANTSNILIEYPRYRERVRGIISVDLQDYIWDNCHETNSAEVQRLNDCEAPNIPIQSETIERLLTDRTLHDDLRYWISTQRVGQSIYYDRLNASAELHDALIAELDDLQ